MSIPRGVKKQAEEAARIQKEINSPPSEPELAVVDDPAPDNDQTDWEKRFKGMKKSHDTTVVGLRNENEQLTGKVSELENLLEKAQDSAPAVQEPTFTDAEVEEYGQDFLDMVSRVANRVGKTGSGVAEELATLKNQFDGIVENQARSAEDQFYADLEAAVPDWEKINESDEFKEWLAELMPMTGQERQVFLAKAHAQYDVSTVISFFTSWKGESVVSYSPDTTTSSNEFEEGFGEDTRVFTASEIQRFYDDKKLGRYRGKEEEARQIELKIFKAQQENRIR